MGNSSVKTKWSACLTRLAATYPTPGMAAARSRKQILTRLRVMPWAFQCVKAQARVSGNWARATSLSDSAAEKALRAMGTQFFFAGSDGKKLKGCPAASLGKFKSSNATRTHRGTLRSVPLAFGSKSFGNMNPRTWPMAPFTSPAPIQRLLVRSTRAPSQRRSRASRPLKSLASMPRASTPLGCLCKAEIAKMGTRR